MSRLEKEKLKAAYPKSAKWAAKVDKMSDAQIYAILCRLAQEENSKEK